MQGWGSCGRRIPQTLTNINKMHFDYRKPHSSRWAQCELSGRQTSNAFPVTPECIRSQPNKTSFSVNFIVLCDAEFLWLYWVRKGQFYRIFKWDTAEAITNIDVTWYSKRKYSFDCFHCKNGSITTQSKLEKLSVEYVIESSLKSSIRRAL